MVKENTLRKLQEGKPTLIMSGTACGLLKLKIGHTGIYDYVEFVAEYGSSDLHDLDNMCRAAEIHKLKLC